MSIEQVPLSEQNEQVIREYFEARSGWEVRKLDLGKAKAADFRICCSSYCFLCEIKTIESVRASLPYTSEYYYLEERRKRQAEIRKWKEENPDKQLLLHQKEWQFINRDEAEFREEYRGIRRYTEFEFKRFEESMKDYFAKSTIAHLPYDVRLDSDDLCVPEQPEAFFAWLEAEIAAIHKGMPSGWWKRESSPFPHYWTFYPIPRRKGGKVPRSEYQLNINGPLKAGSLKVHIHYYGTLNLDAVDRNIERGMSQLESSAQREDDEQIPRIIVLAFESNIGFGEPQLSEYIAWSLKQNLSLSAIAVLSSTLDGTPPPEENGILAWVEFWNTTPWVPCFAVYHNPWLQGVKPLPVDAFSDRWSVHYR